MRIALVRGPYLRPNGVYAWEHLDRTTSHEVVAFESDPARFDTDDLDLQVRSLPWVDGRHDVFGYERFFRRALSRFGLPSDYLRGIRGLVDEFDVVHTSENFNAFSLQAALATRRTETAFAFSAGENIPYPLRQRSPITWRVKSFVNRSAVAMTTTTRLGKRALIHEGVPHERVTVVPNCISGDRFRPLDDVDPSDVGLAENHAETSSILFVHGLTEQKGVPYLLDAFRDIDDAVADEEVQLVLVGENALSAERTRTIENHERITWLERVPHEDMALLYNACDVFVLPSVTTTNNEEQFGMAAVEAMACGLPTVVTDVGGLPFVVDEGRTSLVVPERSSADLREALVTLLSDEDLRARLGAAGREHVLDAFDPDVVAKTLDGFYERIGARRDL